MRFLWKGWPELVKTGQTKNAMLNDILIPRENWQVAWEGGKFTEGAASNAKGEVFFQDVPNSKTYKIGLDGKVIEFIADSKKGNGQAFGPDGTLFAVATATEKIMAYDAAGQGKEVASEIRGNDLVALSNGNLYVTEPFLDPKVPGQVWLIKPDGSKQIVDKGIKFPNGITASPDQSLLYVDDARSHWVYSYQIQHDGTLSHKQRYYWLHVPDTDDYSRADGMEVDGAGRLYVTTVGGLQVCDQAGRVNAILPLPSGRPSNVVFGGADFETIYVTSGDKVFKRKLKAKGAPSFLAPIKPAPPHL
jgi:sugar lactone lactonase YvrE